MTEREIDGAARSCQGKSPPLYNYLPVGNTSRLKEIVWPCTWDWHSPVTQPLILGDISFSVHILPVCHKSSIDCACRILQGTKKTCATVCTVRALLHQRFAQSFWVLGRFSLYCFFYNHIASLLIKTQANNLYV